MTDVDVTRPAAAYSLETRKLVEVAKALYYDPILFIVDETTTALSQSGRKTIYASFMNCGTREKRCCSYPMTWKN